MAKLVEVVEAYEFALNRMRKVYPVQVARIEELVEEYLNHLNQQQSDRSE